MAADRRHLTKSGFLTGHQCRKALHLSIFEREALAPPDAEGRARMAAGQRVGNLARGLFPDGVAGWSHPFDDVEAAAAHTRACLANRPPAVFEATFASPEGLSARVDILARTGRGWRLIEVKSSTSVKPEHLPDVAFQLHVLRTCGIEVEAVELLQPNREYVRRGELDLPAFFTSTNLTADAEARLPAMALLAADLRRMLESGERPEVPIGPQCMDPRECAALETCWADVPPDSVLEISYLRWEEKFALYDRGVRLIDDVPADVRLPSRSRRHVEAHQAHRPKIEVADLRAFLDSLSYPIFLLDFETVAPAIPIWDGTRPYERIPFQFSLHIIRVAGGDPDHTGFLAEIGPDPRPALLDALLPATAGSGSILAYHMPFELGVMKELAAAFPDRRTEIEARLPRMDDLIKPFRGWHYWLPAMGGSFSIKSVAPAIAPELSYEGLEVADGLAASLAYESLLDDPAAPGVDKTRRALLDYCERDTLAMVRVLQAVERAAQGA